VKGFAWTLSIGVLTSVFSALFITRLLVVWWFRSTRNKRLPI
jgi:preprotein translocase subunit SecD